MICVNEVSFGYPHRPLVFQSFNLVISPGETWAVIGPSGSGKSTLLLLLAGLLQPQAGLVTVKGTRLDRPRPRTSLILQDYGLLPWATVRENVALGLRIRRFYGPDGRHAPAGTRLSPLSMRMHVDHWLERLDIGSIAEEYPGHISGGQRQRTAIARALALEPDLLLMDEPFSALDAPTRENLQNLVVQLAAEASLTFVLVTHNIEEAAAIGTKILVLGVPPNSMADTISAPCAGNVGYRGSPAYQAICTCLRQRLELATASNGGSPQAPVFGSPNHPGGDGSTGDSRYESH